VMSAREGKLMLATTRKEVQCSSEVPEEPRQFLVLHFNNLEGVFQDPGFWSGMDAMDGVDKNTVSWGRRPCDAIFGFGRNNVMA
jgi:hypothetical protein